MRIAAQYSHLNGWEYLQVHKPELWTEVCEVIQSINVLEYKTKCSQERTMRGRMLFATKEINKAFEREFGSLGWTERRNTFYVTHDEKVLRKIVSMDAPDQKSEISRSGLKPILQPDRFYKRSCGY